MSRLLDYFYGIILSENKRLSLKETEEKSMKRKTSAYRHSSPFYPPYPNAASASYFKKKRMMILDRIFISALIAISVVFLMRLA